MSEPAPLLSVVTLSLNSAQFLRETLDSVARQTFRDFEHIVVDGGSTDGTQALLAEYPSVRWISEPDGELGFAAKIGAIDTSVKLLIYFLHERLWNKVDYGRVPAPDYEV